MQQAQMQDFSQEQNAKILIAQLKHDLRDEKNLKYINFHIDSNSQSPFPFSWLVKEEQTDNTLLHLIAL